MTFTATFVVPVQWHFSFSDTLIVFFLLTYPEANLTTAAFRMPVSSTSCFTVMPNAVCYDSFRCRLKITGDMIVSFPAGIVQALRNNPWSPALSLHVRNISHVDEILMNKQLISEYVHSCFRVLRICCMFMRVDVLEYNPSLLGGFNCGGGSFARSQFPTAVYMTFFPSDEIHEFFPGFDGTPSIQYHKLRLINIVLLYTMSWPNINDLIKYV